ncbi:sensor histidine kinase [Larkinella sp. VNQ87]|uniref:sensor histidine kinase n=1 Tax=Larkinella sp. VNQ87 TaxID=3400921 RepID=UPI003BFF950F
MRSLFNRINLFVGLFWLLYIIYGVMDSRGWIMQKGLLWALQPLLLFLAMIAVLLAINVRLLIPVFLEKKRFVGYATGLLIIILTYTYLRSLNQQFWDAKVWPSESLTIDSYFYWNSANAVWFLVISTFLYYARKWSEQRRLMKNIQISQLETELKYLRTQVNPHFLFNGLNTIYGTIDQANTQARQMVVQFSDLLRYNLYEADTAFVGLGKEAAYLENYIALQRARSDVSLAISLVIRIENPDRQIAPLLFVAFVENAFKHSTRGDRQENRIDIRLVEEGNGIIFRCVNSYESTEIRPEGIGLTNVRRRLELLYPKRYTLTIDYENNRFTVLLTLPL